MAKKHAYVAMNLPVLFSNHGSDFNLRIELMPTTRKQNLPMGIIKVYIVWSGDDKQVVM